MKPTTEEPQNRLFQDRVENMTNITYPELHKLIPHATITSTHHVTLRQETTIDQICAYPHRTMTDTYWRKIQWN